MRLEQRQSLALQLRQSVLDIVGDQLLAGAVEITAETVDPQDGEAFRAVVKTNLMAEPVFVTVAAGETE